MILSAEKFGYSHQQRDYNSLFWWLRESRLYFCTHTLGVVLSLCDDLFEVGFYLSFDWICNALWQNLGIGSIGFIIRLWIRNAEAHFTVGLRHLLMSPGNLYFSRLANERCQTEKPLKMQGLQRGLHKFLFSLRKWTRHLKGESSLSGYNLDPLGEFWGVLKELMLSARQWPSLCIGVCAGIKWMPNLKNFRHKPWV